MSETGDTTSMLANLLGLGPLLQTAQDPAFLQHVQTIVAAIGETRERCQRIEQWCLRLSEQIERLEYASTAAGPADPSRQAACSAGAARTAGAA